MASDLEDGNDGVVKTGCSGYSCAGALTTLLRRVVRATLVLALSWPGALTILLTVFLVTMHQRNDLWGFDGDWSRFHRVAQGAGCDYYDAAKVSCPFPNQSAAVCLQIDDNAVTNLPTFNVFNFTGDDYVDGWRFGNDTVKCLRCLAATGDPSQDITSSGCELACGFVCRGRFINGTNMCVPPAIFTEDLYLYGISFGAMVLSVVVLPLLASFVPVEGLRVLIHMVAMVGRNFGFMLLSMVIFILFTAKLVIWAETGYARAQCISTGSMFWVLYVLLGISQFTIQAGYGGIKLVIEKLKNYGKSKSAKTVLDDPDVQSMMGMFFCASYCCAFVCCFLPALIVLLVLVSDSVGIDSTGAAVLLGVAFSAIACTYFSWKLSQKMRVLNKFLTSISELNQEREIDLRAELPDPPAKLHYISKASQAGEKSKLLINLSTSEQWQALVTKAGKDDWTITECTNVPEDLLLTSHMWSTTVDPEGKEKVGGTSILEGIAVVGIDGIESTIDFPQDVLLRYDSESDAKIWIDVLSHLNRKDLLEKTVPFMGKLYPNRTVDPVWLDYDVTDLKKAFGRGWIYQETANTKLKEDRVRKYLCEHKAKKNNEALELLFVRRGSNLPRILEQLRKERPMSLREVAIIFAHLEYSGLTMQEMLRGLVKVLSRHCTEDWFVKALVSPTKHQSDNPIQAFQMLHAYCSLEVRDNCDAPAAIIRVAAETDGKSNTPHVDFLQENWGTVVDCGIGCSVGCERFKKAQMEAAIGAEQPLVPLLVSAGLGVNICTEYDAKYDAKSDNDTKSDKNIGNKSERFGIKSDTNVNGKKVRLLIKCNTLEICPLTGKGASA